MLYHTDICGPAAQQGHLQGPRVLRTAPDIGPLNKSAVTTHGPHRKSQLIRSGPKQRRLKPQLCARQLPLHWGTRRSERHATARILSLLSSPAQCRPQSQASGSCPSRGMTWARTGAGCNTPSRLQTRGMHRWDWARLDAKADVIRIHEDKKDITREISDTEGLTLRRPLQHSFRGFGRPQQCEAAHCQVQARRAQGDDARAVEGKEDCRLDDTSRYEGTLVSSTPRLQGAMRWD